MDTLNAARAALAIALAIAPAVALEAVDAPTTAASMPEARALAPLAPHELAPDAALQPDYFAAALAITGVQVDARYRTPRLRASDRAQDPAFIVLPVQSQAWGFSPVARAMAGAELDRLLAARGVDASRQTDILDADGPFVRRFDEGTIAAFAAAHPASTLLVPYVGRDRNGHAFVTLERRDGGKPTLVHERVDLPEKDENTPMPVEGVGVLVDALARQLEQLKVGKPAALPAPERAGCAASDWALADPGPATGPVERACHALIMGSLMPDYLSVVSQAMPNAPDRLAWLAQAWAEARPFAARLPAMNELARLAAAQLRFDLAVARIQPAVDSDDPVVRPLARMRWANGREEKGPRRSPENSAEAYMRSAATTLPSFARALAIEQVRYADTFATVDLCPMAAALPAMRRPPECDSDVPAAPPDARPTRSTAALLEAWRLAAAAKALYYEGRTQGNAEAFERASAAVPARFAGHPIIGEVRFAAWVGLPPTGGTAAYVDRVRAAATSYMQAMATLQRIDAFTLKTDFDWQTLHRLGIGEDPVLSKYADDRARLRNVALSDLYGALLAVMDAKPGQPQAELARGSYLDAQMAMSRLRNPQGIALPASGAVSAESRLEHNRTSPQAVSEFAHRRDALPSEADLEQAVEHQPQDMTARTQLALVRLKHGEPLARALEAVDGRTGDARAAWRVGESHELAEPAAAFFYAGDLATAKLYYDKVVAFGTGSESELAARVRLAQIAGDLPAALAAARRRYERYGGDFALRDVAGFSFALGQPLDGWKALLPQMQTARFEAPWIAAFAGLRADGVALAAVPGWLEKNGLDKLRIGYLSSAQLLVPAYAFVDRLPGPDELDWLRTHYASAGLVERAQILGIALRDERDPAAEAALMRRAPSGPVAGIDSEAWQPFLELARWQASDGKAPSLDEARNVPADSNLSWLMAKAVVLALDGKRAEALSALRAARWEMGRPTPPAQSNDPLFTAGYRYVLTGWAIARKTGERAFADEALALARSEQRVLPYLGWPYAAEALLATDTKARTAAACRAQALDAGSLLLQRSGLHPDAKACRAAAR